RADHCGLGRSHFDRWWVIVVAAQVPLTVPRCRPGAHAMGAQRGSYGRSHSQEGDDTAEISTSTGSRQREAGIIEGLSGPFQADGAALPVPAGSDPQAFVDVAAQYPVFELIPSDSRH